MGGEEGGDDALGFRVDGVSAFGLFLERNDESESSAFLGLETTLPEGTGGGPCARAGGVGSNLANIYTHFHSCPHKNELYKNTRTSYDSNGLSKWGLTAMILDVPVTKRLGHAPNKK